MPYVVSTLSSTQEYAEFEKPMSDGGHVARPAQAKRHVKVMGGANVQGVLRTPEGVLTKITEADADFLQNHKVFKRHAKRGYVKVIQREANPDKVAKDLLPRDGSAPLNAAFGDFDKGGRAAGLAPKNQNIQ